MENKINIDMIKLSQKNLKCECIININKISMIKFKARFNLFLFLFKIIIKICPIEIILKDKYQEINENNLICNKCNMKFTGQAEYYLHIRKCQNDQT